MPRNRLDGIAHTRAGNRARAMLAKLHPGEYADLYEQYYAEARTEVYATAGELLPPGPKRRERDREPRDNVTVMRVRETLEWR